MLSVHGMGKIEYDELEHIYKVNTLAPISVESQLFDLIKSNEADVVNVTFERTV